MRCVLTTALLGLAPALTLAAQGPATPQEPAAAEGRPPAGEAEARQLGERFVAAFNGGDVEALVGFFAPEAELVDEEGNVYRGREAIAEVLGRFFAQYPGASMAREVEGLRLVGPSLAIEDGVVTITSKERATARNRFIAVLARGDDGWRVASMRQVADEPPTSAGASLEPLGWLVGDWVAEGAEQSISLSFRRSDDGNYLLGSYTVGAEGQEALSTAQRIGWDAAAGVIRSWNFDSDGGFSEGRWSTDGSSWVVKSELVLPDGLTGSATFYLSPVDQDRFVWSSIDRVVAGEVQPDVEVTIVRKPPSPR